MLQSLERRSRLHQCISQEKEAAAEAVQVVVVVHVVGGAAASAEACAAKEWRVASGVGMAARVVGERAALMVE